MNAVKAQAVEVIKKVLSYDRARKFGQKAVRAFLIFYINKANGKLEMKKS